MELVDYRNGKYQGPLTPGTSLRHGLGILIDDDLSMYASHWQYNKLHGSTLIYLKHGQYVYGEWKDNQPNGLNVVRLGQTVLIGKWRDGKLSEKGVVIFQKFNFIAIIEVDQEEDRFQVIERGYLKNHATLIKYLQYLPCPVPEYYFSLTKFACYLSSPASSQIRTFPCQGANCYFGFINGLAIIFNSSNAVISVGCHSGEKLGDFGGKFDGGKGGCQGNFEENDLITYKRDRPVHKIYALFQKLHKRSLNFKNEYFDSKAKILGDLYQLLRGKIKEIVDDSRRGHQFTATQLNDSLDYQQYSEQQTNKMIQIRQDMYEGKKIDRQRQKSPVKEKGPSVALRQKSIYAKKSPIRQKKDSLYEMPEKVQITKTFSRIEQERKKQTQHKQQIHEVEIRQRKNNVKYINNISPSPVKLSKRCDPQTPIRNNASVSPFRGNNQIYKNNCNIITDSNHKKDNKIQVQSQIKKSNDGNDSYRVPTFKGLIQEMQSQRKSKQTQIQQEMRQSKQNPSPKYDYDNSPIAQKLRKRKQQKKEVSQLARPSYQDIEERRKRILKEFKQINSKVQLKESQTQHKKQPNLHQGSYQQCKTKEISAQLHRNPLLNFESPANAVAFSTNQTNQQSSFGFLPLTIANKNYQQTHLPCEVFEKIDLQSKNAFKKDISCSKLPTCANTQERSPKNGNSSILRSRQKQNGQRQVTTPARKKRSYQYVYE